MSTWDYLIGYVVGSTIGGVLVVWNHVSSPNSALISGIITGIILIVLYALYNYAKKHIRWQR